MKKSWAEKLNDWFLMEGKCNSVGSVPVMWCFEIRFDVCSMNSGNLESGVFNTSESLNFYQDLSLSQKDLSTSGPICCFFASF